MDLRPYLVRPGWLAIRVLCIALTISWTAAARADEDIAKQLNNPVADLISFPFQSNFDFNVGSSDGWRNTTNIQPVIPIRLNEDWNVISRTILPVVTQQDISGDSGSQTGLSDTTQSLFFSPRAAAEMRFGNLIWGVGPVVTLPTSTHRLLGPGVFGVGPTGVVLVQEGPWTYGALANHVWGLAYSRDDHSQINNTFVQPFLAYTTPDAWTYSLNTELTHNWANGKTAGPVNLGLSKLVNIGEQKVSLQGRLRWWAAETESSPQGLGFTLSATFVF